MQRLRWIFISFIILAAFGVIFFILYKQSSTLDKDENLTRAVPSPKNNLLSSGIDQTVRVNRDADVDDSTKLSESASPSIDDLAIDPILRPLAPLIKGVDSLTAAKTLQRESYFEYAYRYAQQAVAENPESFEALLCLAQLTPHDGTEREETFRRLFEMNPTSVEVLYGLGQTLSRTKPAEAIPYLKAIIEVDPLYRSVYHVLGQSYQSLGMYDEALVAHKKAYEINPTSRTLRYIKAIEAGNPIIKPLQRQSEPGEQATSPEDIPAQVPRQEVAPVTSPAPQGSEHVTELGESPPEAEKRTLSPETQQAMEAEFEKLIAEYERMIRGESAPDESVNRTILDLKRSIESSPNRSDSYLELGRAYEKVGEDEKAAVVYRQARKRFPRDKRFRRTLKDKASTNRSGRERPPQHSDKEKDSPSKDER